MSLREKLALAAIAAIGLCLTAVILVSTHKAYLTPIDGQAVKVSK